MRERNRLGFRIRHQRQKLGLTKSELSRQVGVTPTAVHNWEENGVVPRPPMFASLARVLQVSEAFLTSTGDADEVGSGREAGLGKVEDFKRQIADTLGVNQNQIEISVRL